jgi:iron-sulfur cluster assembly accessory protein
MTGNSEPVCLTDRAAQRIMEIAREQPSEGSMLRIAVTGGGCSGFQYDFSLVAQPAGDDLVIEKDGAVVLIDPVSLDFLRGAEIDFADEMIGAAFRIKNPNATSSCGCGTSFSI